MIGVNAVFQYNIRDVLGTIKQYIYADSINDLFGKESFFVLLFLLSLLVSKFTHGFIDLQFSGSFLLLDYLILIFALPPPVSLLS